MKAGLKTVERTRVRWVRAEGEDAQTLALLRALPAEVDVATGPAADASPSLLEVIDYDRLPDAVKEQLCAKVEHTRIFLSDGPLQGRLAKFFEARALRHLLPRERPRELFVTLQKLLRRELFGAAPYLAWGASTHALWLTRSAEKEGALAAAEAFADRHGVTDRFKASIVSACEELLSNALFDAPVDASGAFRFAHLARNTPVVLGAGKKVQLGLACDGARFAVAVSDPFGSLTAEVVQRSLARCYRGGADQIEEKPGGAGVGLYTAMESCSHLVVNLAPGKRTELIALLEVGGTYKDFKSRSKSFNLFEA